MKLNYVDGCTTFFLTIDDKVIKDIDNETWEEFCEKLKHSKIDRENMIREHVRYSGKIVYESDGPCECCGDYVTEYEMEI
jgi:hypothetical protein